MADDQLQPSQLPNHEQREDPDSLLEWQIDHIKKGMEQAERGELISHEEVMRIAATWSHSAKKK